MLIDVVLSTSDLKVGAMSDENAAAKAQTAATEAGEKMQEGAVAAEPQPSNASWATDPNTPAWATDGGDNDADYQHPGPGDDGE